MLLAPRPFRSLLALAGGLTLSMTASAQQTQRVCHSNVVVLQNTDWNATVSIPKFDPNLGTLQSIQFTLTGNSAGSARAESLDAQASTVTLTFRNTLTLTRPDLSVIGAQFAPLPTVDVSLRHRGGGSNG